MADGEDRHFCAHADAVHIEMVADAWPDIWHCYHPETDYGRINEMLQELEERKGFDSPSEMMYSAKVRNLEAPAVPTQYIRGRLGSIKALPEVLEALAAMEPGETRLILAHFPIHWELPDARNATMTLEVTLCDKKPWRLPPVIDGEIFLGRLSKSFIDTTTLTLKQCEDIGGNNE